MVSAQASCLPFPHLPRPHLWSINCAPAACHIRALHGAVSSLHNIIPILWMRNWRRPELKLPAHSKSSRVTHSGLSDIKSSHSSQDSALPPGGKETPRIKVRDETLDGKCPHGPWNMLTPVETLGGSRPWVCFFLTRAHRVGSVLWLVGMAGAAWSSLFT